MEIECLARATEGFLESNLSEILKIQSEIFYNVSKILEKYKSSFFDYQVIGLEVY